MLSPLVIVNLCTANTLSISPSLAAVCSVALVSPITLASHEERTDASNISLRIFPPFLLFYILS